MSKNITVDERTYAELEDIGKVIAEDLSRNTGCNVQPYEPGAVICYLMGYTAAHNAQIHKVIYPQCPLGMVGARGAASDAPVGAVSEDKKKEG
jgi:hypothetical protein